MKKQRGRPRKPISELKPQQRRRRLCEYHARRKFLKYVNKPMRPVPLREIPEEMRVRLLSSAIERLRLFMEAGLSSYYGPFHIGDNWLANTILHLETDLSEARTELRIKQSMMRNKGRNRERKADGTL